LGAFDQQVWLLLIFLAIVLMIIYVILRGPKKGSIQRQILDALIENGCVENPLFMPRSATAREIAHMIYSKDEYLKNPDNFDCLTACNLIKMEKRGYLGNSGETTDCPEIAVKKGRWYIKWHPPSD
jgi:hypothetical protein